MAEHLERIKTMAETDQTKWDLSPNDAAALRWAVAKLGTLTALRADNERLQRELAEVKAGYRQLDASWHAVHEGAMQPIREAIGEPDAGVHEIVRTILHWKAQAGEVERLRGAIEDWRLTPERQPEETGDSLVDRLRGIYTIPVNDGAGPLNGKMTYTNRFFTGKIMHEAAAEIERLRSVLASGEKGEGT